MSDLDTKRAAFVEAERALWVAQRATDEAYLQYSQAVHAGISERAQHPANDPHALVCAIVAAQRGAAPTHITP